MDAKHFSNRSPFLLFIQTTFFFAIYASLTALYFHNFVPETAAKTFAHRISLYFSVCFLISLVYLIVNNSMPSPFWNKQSRFAKLMLMVLFVPLYYLFFWISFANALPLIYTSVVGETKTMDELVSREYVDSRKSCDYRLKFKSIDSSLFHFCLRPEVYEQMNKGEYAVETTIKQSELGYYIKSVRFVDSESMSVLVNQKNIHNHVLLVLILVLTATLTFELLKKHRKKTSFLKPEGWLM